MKKQFSSVIFGLAILAMASFALAGSVNAQIRVPGRMNGRGERHPKIKQAVKALENARTDLQNAAHDFCGHREDALDATDKDLAQLRLALGSDRAQLVMPPANQNVSFINAAYQQNNRERHPEIRRAINALNRAKEDLEDASHDFQGHREAALDATNNALRQLQAALACDKR
ncbi:MAG: hypothetical protein ACR2GD_06725 [Pyrinomonadaceae bacterium]